MLRIAIGVMAFNEGANLGRLLATLVRSRVTQGEINKIIVVSSGSTDNSVEIAAAWRDKDHRVQVISEAERRGKASAINRFLLAADADICVIIGADVVPEENAIDLLVRAFADPGVGMTGAHPCPTNPERGLINRIVHLQWRLLHLVALEHPKLGELIAFRKALASLDPTTPVDEAFSEAWFTARGLRLAYVPDAMVYNRGPDSLAEFIEQRRRIWAGHLWLRRETGYRVATYRIRSVMPFALKNLAARPRDLGVTMAAALLEIVARLLGTYDVLVQHSKPTIWKRLASTKSPILPKEPDA